MREFSDSFHVLSDGPDYPAALIERSGCRGMVVPTEVRFVPFVALPRSGSGDAVERVVEHHRGVLLHYARGIDHGTWIRVFADRTLRCAISLASKVSGPPMSIPRVMDELQRLGIAGGKRTARLRALLSELPAPGLDYDACDSLSMVTRAVVEVLGMRYLPDLSCSDLYRVPPAELLARFPGSRLIGMQPRPPADAVNRRQP